MITFLGDLRKLDVQTCVDADSMLPIYHQDYEMRALRWFNGSLETKQARFHRTFRMAIWSIFAMVHVSCYIPRVCAVQCICWIEMEDV